MIEYRTQYVGLPLNLVKVVVDIFFNIIDSSNTNMIYKVLKQRSQWDGRSWMLIQRTREVSRITNKTYFSSAFFSFISKLNNRLWDQQQTTIPLCRRPRKGKVPRRTCPRWKRLLTSSSCTTRRDRSWPRPRPKRARFIFQWALNGWTGLEISSQGCLTNRSESWKTNEDGRWAGTSGRSCAHATLRAII